MILTSITSLWLGYIPGTWLADGTHQTSTQSPLQLIIHHTVPPRLVLQTEGESWRHVGSACKSLSCQVLLKGPKDMEIAGCEMGTAGWEVQNLPDLPVGSSNWNSSKLQQRPALHNSSLPGYRHLTTISSALFFNKRSVLFSYHCLCRSLKGCLFFNFSYQMFFTHL